jgi:hypothetical protein
MDPVAALAAAQRETKQKSPEADVSAFRVIMP